MMIAKARLFLTVNRDALVAEGDPLARFLYAAPGDEIPDSVVEAFDLVDGDLPPIVAIDAAGIAAAEAQAQASAQAKAKADADAAVQAAAAAQAEADAKAKTDADAAAAKAAADAAAKEQAPGDDKEQTPGENKGGKRGTPPDQKGD